MGDTSHKHKDDYNKILAHYNVIWGNIHHNETTRNRFFQFYLVVAGSFLAVVQSAGLATSALAYGSTAVWVLGLFFLWAYERLGEMIYRDNNIIRTIIDELEYGGDIEKQIHKNYLKYRKSVGGEVREWWSLTSCVMYATSIVSAIVLNIGLKSLFDFHWNWSFILVPFFAILNIQVIKLMNRIARIGD